MDDFKEKPYPEVLVMKVVKESESKYTVRDISEAALKLIHEYIEPEYMGQEPDTLTFRPVCQF